MSSITLQNYQRAVTKKKKKKNLYFLFQIEAFSQGPCSLNVMCEDLFIHITFGSRVRLLGDNRENNRGPVEMVMCKHKTWALNCTE